MQCHIAGDEKDVEALIHLMPITWINPLQENNDLVYLAVELEVTVHIKDDPLSASDTEQ